MNVSKLHETKGEVAGLLENGHPFELPRSIARQLKKCAAEFKDGKRPGVDGVEYLWVNLDGRGVEPGESASRTPRTLLLEEWLSVVDEAASLGVRWLLVCAGDSLSTCSDVWTICRWAQDIHNMTVGMYTSSCFVSEADLHQFRELDLSKTCLFVGAGAYEEMRAIREQGIPVCVADVADEDHSPPCAMPECMVYVGPDGKVYTCGLVFGHKSFCLGSVFDRRLEDIVQDDSLPHSVNDRPRGCTCNACPPIMAARAREARERGA